ASLPAHLPISPSSPSTPPATRSARASPTRTPAPAHTPFASPVSWMGTGCTISPAPGSIPPTSRLGSPGCARPSPNSSRPRAASWRSGNTSLTVSSTPPSSAPPPPRGAGCPTGARLHSSYLAPRLAWLREAEPELFAATSRFMALGEYISHRLVDAPALGTAAAAWGGMLDRRRGEYVEELLAAVDVSAESLG